MRGTTLISVAMNLLLHMLLLTSYGSKDISKRLFDLYNTFINETLITDTYKQNVILHRINTSVLGSEVANVTSNEFGSASTALTKIKDTGKKSYENHIWDKRMKLNYWNGFTKPLQSTNGSKLPLTHLDRYDADVSLSESTINLPIDVYDNWTEVRNTIQWTKGLDKAFIENYNNNEENIFWQYIGTPQGVMRTFPATYISAKDQVEFDVRKRPWYNAGIGCPKDMVLLIDTSGSLEGFPVRLLKTTARSLIELIVSDTDFITVIGVGHTAEYLTCYHHLMRANKAVKKVMIDAINAIRPNGTSNWELGFQKAFKTLKGSHEINQSADCEKAIVLFSDETGQAVTDIVKELNPDKDVRVYVFSFRRNEGLYSDKLRELACSNRGYYSKVLYFGQIESALQRLVQVGNSGLKDAEVAPTWSNAYRDLAGFGLVITVTLPIVVLTSPSEIKATKLANNSISLLGIVGLDFKSSRIVQISNSIMPLSVSTVIVNNKGYPVYHPRIDKYEFEDVNTKFRKFQYTDANLEKLIRIETLMIDQKNDTVVITDGFLNIAHQQRGSEWYQELTYHIFEVENTPFSIACVFVQDPINYLLFKPKLKGHNTPLLLKVGDVKRAIKKWKQNRGILTNFAENSCNVNVVLAKTDGYYQWDKNNFCSTVTYALFTDIYLSQHFWEAFKRPQPSKNNLLSHFIITYSGIMFYSNAGWLSDNVTSLTTLTPFAKTIKNITQASLFLSIPFRRDKYNMKSINVTRRVTVTLGNVTTQVAAVGVELRMEYVRTHLLGKYTDKYERLLVDENSYIIMAYPVEVSGFLSERYPYLMKKLLDKNIFQRINYTECINECKERIDKPHHSHNSAARTFSFKPFLFKLFATIMNFIANLKLIFYLDYFTYSGVSGNHIVKERTVECCKMFNHYQRNFKFNQERPYSVAKLCKCNSHYDVSAVPDTNLLLVIDKEPGCKCSTPTIMDSPEVGQRSYQNEVCRIEDEEHGNEDSELEINVNHYYRNAKSCHKSLIDEGLCSRGVSHGKGCGILIAMLTVVMRLFLLM